MTPYYITAVAFGGLSAVLSAYAIWGRKEHTRFPGSLSVPIVLAGFAFAVATLAFVVIGGGKEHKEHEKTADHAAASFRA